MLDPKVVTVYDVDGVLVEMGERRVPSEVSNRFAINTIPTFVATGKPINWAWDIAVQIWGCGVFGENGAVYQMAHVENWGYTRVEEEVLTVDPGDIHRLLELLHFRRDDRNPYMQASITVEGKTDLVLVEPDKKVAVAFGTRGMHGFPFPSPGCRWSGEELCESISRLIEENGLGVRVIGPHPDGNIDFQPMVSDKVVDKSVIPGILRKLYPNAQIVVLVDGVNDISLAQHPDVFPITFANGCVQVKDVVRERGGLLINKVGYEGGVLEALEWINHEMLQIPRPRSPVS